MTWFTCQVRVVDGLAIEVVQYAPDLASSDRLRAAVARACNLSARKRRTFLVYRLDRGRYELRSSRRRQGGRVVAQAGPVNRPADFLF